MAVKGHRLAFNSTAWVAFGYGKCPLALGANGHVADAGNGLAHVGGCMGADYCAAVACAVAKANDAAIVFFE